MKERQEEAEEESEIEEKRRLEKEKKEEQLNESLQIIPAPIVKFDKR